MLKKTDYRESDQIVTIWSDEFGKIRVLARGLRLPKSKLAGALQDLSLVDFEVTGRWPTIISAQVVLNFKGIRSNLAKMAPAFYATELMLKTTADENPNIDALKHLLDFLRILDQEENLEVIHVAMLAFTLKLLSCLGYSADYLQDNFKVNQELSGVLQTLRQKDLTELKVYVIPNSVAYRLKIVINQLLEFVLERELKSQALFSQLK